MSFLIGKTEPAAPPPPPPPPAEEENDGGATINNNNSKNSGEELQGVVSSHVYLKPVHSTEKFSKEVALRRIRQRKRVNKVRAALKGFAGGNGYSPSASSDIDDIKKVHVRWLDDAFAAP